MPTLRSGYVYEAPIGATSHKKVDNEDWDTVVYTATDDEEFAGTIFIDGAACRAFLCADGRYRAALHTASSGATGDRAER